MVRVAFLLLLIVACCGCPRTRNETLPLPKATKLEQPQIKVSPRAAIEKPDPNAIKEIKPPIMWLELASEMRPAPLPAEIVVAHPGAEMSTDTSALLKTKDETREWYQAFDTSATDEELLRYYGGMFGLRGFATVSSAPETVEPGDFDTTWKSKDGRHTVHVYSFNDVTTSAKNRNAYIIHILDTGKTAAASEKK